MVSSHAAFGIFALFLTFGASAFPVVETELATNDLIPKSIPELEQSPNSLQVLNKRRPADGEIKCDQPSHWRGRSCDGSGGNTRAWRDYCSSGGNLYDRPGTCPENTICDPSQDEQGNDDIHCMPEASPSDKSDIRKDQKRSTWGRIKSFLVGRDKKRTQQIEIKQPLLGATFSAVLRSVEGNSPWIVAPITGITAVLTRWSNNKLVCSYDAKHHECKPTGKFDFQVGDIIEVDYDLEVTQQVFVYFAVLGPNPIVTP